MKNSAVLVTGAEISLLVFESVDLYGYAGGHIVALDKSMQSQLRYRLMYFEAVLDDWGLDMWEIKLKYSHVFSKTLGMSFTTYSCTFTGLSCFCLWLTWFSWAGEKSWCIMAHGDLYNPAGPSLGSVLLSPIWLPQFLPIVWSDTGLCFWRKYLEGVWPDKKASDMLTCAWSSILSWILVTSVILQRAGNVHFLHIYSALEVCVPAYS